MTKSLLHDCRALTSFTFNREDPEVAPNHVLSLALQGSKEFLMEYTWPAPFSADVVRPVFGRVSAYTIALEAWRRGLTVTAINGGLQHFWVEDDKGHAVKFIGSRPSMTTSRALSIAADKHQTNTLLREAGLSAPESQLIDTRAASHAQVSQLASTIGFPVVLKPLKGTKGKGVFTNIQSNVELLEYYHHLVNDLGYTHVVIESQAPGEDDVRVLVIGDRLAGAALRTPANVIGDGENSIDQLISLKNAVRAKNPFLHSGPIKRDNEVLNYIDQAGHTLQTVLAEGVHLRLRGKSNGSAGGDSVDITDDLPDSIKDRCIRAVRAVPGLFCAGVDILYNRSAVDSEHNYSIIELNATPQIGLNMYPIAGFGQDVPKTWLDVCFPDSRRSLIAGEEALTFSLDEVLPALRSGAASRVTISPIPELRLPCRRSYDVASEVVISENRQKRLVILARRLGVSGALLGGSNGYTLTVAAEDADTCYAFVRGVAKELRSATLSQFRNWNGVVRAGFRVKNSQVQQLRASPAR